MVLMRRVVCMAALAAARLARDPRRSARCVNFYGPFEQRRQLRRREPVHQASTGEPCDASAPRLAPLRSVEDVVANRTRAAEPPKFLSRYGAALPDGSRWVEIPKTGSWGFKAGLGRWLEREYPYAVRRVARCENKSFAFVREPLQRLVSAFGTVSHRSRLLEAGDASSFGRFVDLLLAHGDRAHVELDREWFHALSQVYFIKLFPREIDFVVHLERVDEEWAALAARVALPPANAVRYNAVEGFADRADRDRAVRASLEEDPALPAKLWRWLAHDYACLGYPVPPVLREAAGRDT